MRIGFDAKRLYNNFTGLGNYSRTLLTNLQRAYPEDNYYLYTPKIRETPETNDFLQNPGYHTVLPARGMKSYWRACSVKQNLKKDGIELYHGLSHEIPLNIQKTGIKSVVTIHDIIYKTYPDMFPAIDRCFYDLKFRYSCKHADKVIAISESTKRDIIHYFGTPEEKIEVIYQAINPIFYKLQEKEQTEQIIRQHNIPADFLLYVGAINSRKNLLSILKAYEFLPKDLQLPLVIIGNGGQYKTEVLKYAETHQLSHLIILINNLSDTRTLQAFYQNASIFIYPSFYEGFGLPVTEALLSRTPVITSGISSLPEAGGQAAWYADPGSPEEIATGIKAILTDSAKREAMKEEGYQYAHRQFAPELLTSQVHRLYHSLQ